MAVESPARAGLAAVPALFVTAALAQVGYPLVSGSARDVLTVFIVGLVATAAGVHAAISRGARTLAVLVAVTVFGGFAVELIGVHTGVPFGRYRYASSLGPTVLGVPMLISLAWPMLAWPAALAAQRLVRTFPLRVLLGGWALATWDLFLDPQMVDAGHWRWLDPAPHLPGVATVPLSDYAGWLLISLGMSFALQCALERAPQRAPQRALQRAQQSAPRGDDRWPLGFYVWTWASSTLALAAFLGLDAAALWGAVGMGTVAVPLLRSLARSR